MASLIVGMDVSGNIEFGNYQFMAIVIGTKERIDSLVRRSGNRKIHMTTIRNKKEQNRILESLIFDHTECIAFCIRLEREKILEKIRNTERKNRSLNNRKLLHAYHHLVWRAIRDNVEKFLHQHGYGISDVVFQCDGDCRSFAKDLGWHHEAEGSAHMLADAVAWANSHGREPTGVVHLDMLHTQMVKRLK